MENLDLMWLAGLLEGEGWFSTVNSRVGGKLYRYPIIGVTMTDRDVVDHVAGFWGNKVVTIRPYGVSKKVSYRATISGKKAIEQMILLRPHMGDRRKTQIDTAMAEWESRELTSSTRKRSCQEAVKKRVRSEDGRFLPKK